MPTSEQLSLNINEAAKTLTLSHRANATTDSIQVLSERKDGLTITGTASQVPTAFDLGINLAGSATIDVTPIGAGTTDNNLDIKLEAKKTGGFLDTDAFLGYDLGYAAVEMTDVSDAFIGFDPATDSVGVHTIVPTESIGAIALIIGDDDNLELPPAQDDLLGGTPWADPNRHVFSLIDDGTHGTAAARLVHVQNVTLDLDAASIAEAFTMKFSQAAPLTAYLRTTPTSNLISGHDIEVTLNVNNMPAGQSSFNADFPTDFTYDLPGNAVIDSIHAFGHIDCVFFDVLISHLPNKFQFSFDPNGAVTLLAQDGSGNPDRVGAIAVRLFHQEIPGFTCPDDSLLPGSPLPDLLGDELQEARLRLDDIPSFHATWSDAASTAINFNTDANDVFLGGAQVAVSTKVDLTALPVVNTPALVAAASDYLAFKDRSGTKQLKAGAFGIDAFTYASSDATAKYDIHYDANAQHTATVDINSAFGGRFFPDFDVHGAAPAALDSNANLTISKVPQLLDISVQADPEFHYHGSQGVSLITLSGMIDDTNDGLNNGTNVAARLENLPKDVDFVLDPAASATLTMNAPAGLVQLHLDSDNSIFGSDYRLLEASIADIPAHWNADWSGGQFVLEAKDASNNPSPMGALTATISKTNVASENDANITPFRTSGPAGARIHYSDFTKEIDNRNYGAAPGGGAATLAALNALYNNAQVLDSGEDHAVARINGGSLSFFDGKFTGFQKIAYQPSSNGGHYEFRAPTPGLHPLFAGAGIDSDFLFAQIDNIPDAATLDIDLAGQKIHFHTDDDTGATAGNIDVYFGPENMAQDGDTAVRGIMQDTPDDVVISWGFGFPNGNANVTASNEFTLLFAGQDGGSRLTAGLRLQELQVGYDLDVLPLDIDVDFIYTPLPVPTSVDLVLFRATAGIDNDTADPSIAANPAKPGVDGFFSLYTLKTGTVDDPIGSLDPSGPAAGASEYVPELSFMMRDFRLFSIDFELQVEVIPVPLVPSIEGPNISLSGDFVFDVWTTSDVDATIGTPLGDIGFRNIADYKDNTPIHIIPFNDLIVGNPEGLVITFGGFHDFDDHFDPLA